VGALALMVFTSVMLRSRLEPTAQAQRSNQVAGCDGTTAPSRTNPCLVISSFRENGPGGSMDEFVEIFNASTVPLTVSTISDDPTGISNGIGVFVSAGQGFNPVFLGAAANEARLACQVKGATIIQARRWFLCAGTPGGAPLPSVYSLGALGTNSGGLHSTPDANIGGLLVNGGTAPIIDLPDDGGLALLNIGTDIVTQCVFGSLNCSTGFNYSAGLGIGNAVVLDKVGFNPWGPGSPANTGGGYPNNIYPSLARQYCEGTCIQPVGDASVITLPAGQPCPPNVQPSNPGYTVTPSPTPPFGPQYDTAFPVTSGGPVFNAQGILTTVNKCYGESGQYKIERRRSTQTFNDASGEIHKDSWNSEANNNTTPQNTFGACAVAGLANCGNADDFILDAPDPAAANVGLTESGVSAVTSVLGNAWPHNCDGVFNGGPAGIGCTAARFPVYTGAPPIIGNNQFTQGPFDNCAGAVIPCSTVGAQLQPRNAERRYAWDPTILGVNNDPFGTFIVRVRYTNSTGGATSGQRWRINDISTLCGGQTPTTTALGSPQSSAGVATQEARNLRGPDFSTSPALTPTPTCQGEGSDVGGVFTAILKGVNHYGEVVVDSSGTARVVAGSVLEDVFTAPAPPPPTGALQPFGGGSNSTFVVNTTAVGNQTPSVAPAGPAGIPNVGDGVSGGTGSFPFIIGNGSTFRIAFKFGVVRSGRFKLAVGREIAGVAATPQN